MQKLIEFVRWKLGLTPEAASKRALAAVPLRPGEIGLDCGANIGDMTAVLACHGGTVHAFEPNPFAFAVLQKRFEHMPHVACHQVAISDCAGRMPLYLHQNSANDEVYWSNGSSLMAEKSNVSKTRAIEVDTIDLAHFLRGLGQEVRVLKMDIEGAEFAVLEHLIATHTLDLVDHLFVETHDEKIPGLAEIGVRVRLQLANRVHPKIHLDWV